MAFSRGTFLGASLQNVNASIAWNSGGASTCTINLAEDASNGDSFSPVEVGEPVYFSYGGFNFYGLLQSWNRKNSDKGNPVYETTIVDPRELLDGVHLILSDYSGVVNSVSNLLNPYGWWEANGFGASESTDAGMPWTKILAAVNAMTATANGTPYGAPIAFKGVKYKLDLSQLPVPSSQYRMGGPSITLMEAISQICEDGGCDFFVELFAYTIRVRVASRVNQPPLGTISSFISSADGNIVRSSNGLESRNETTTSFLVGGPKTTVYETDEIYQFWGYDFDSVPILSTTGVVTYPDNPPPANAVPIETEFALLNASPVSSVIGDVRYKCSTLEMRCARAGYYTWATFIGTYKPQLASHIKIANSFAAGTGFLTAVLRQDVVNAATNQAVLMSANSVTGTDHIKSMQLYEFVRAYADEYMGRKYLVRLSQVDRKQDPDTLKYTNSYDIADAGWLDEGSAPLGTSDDTFKATDGRFRPFVRYDNVGSGVDLSTVSPNGTVISESKLFANVSLSSSMVFDNNSVGYALMTMPNALVEESVDAVGGLDVLGQVLHNPNINGLALFKNGHVPLKIAPAVRDPDQAAIPLRSNTLTYGPWGAMGVPGKVKFDSDPSMTPWNYGSVEAMDFAGNARVSTAITNMQSSEHGFIEVAGAPAVSMGDALQTGGPLVTNINFSVSPQGGVTTTYEFRTFTPRFGTASKASVERLRRLSLTNVELQRSLRTNAKEAAYKSGVLSDAAANAVGGNGKQKFFGNASKAILRESPHDVLVAYSVLDSGTSTVRQMVSTAMYEEAVGLSNADDDGEYRATSIMGMNGLIRPFGINSGNSELVSQMGGASGTNDAPSSVTLNPFKEENDIEIVSHGDTYSGLHVYRDGFPTDGVRAISLRGPQIVTGWGYGIDGTKHPGNWPGGYLLDHSTWKTGPVDNLWDPRRGVWTSHTNLTGLVNYIPAGGSGIMTVEDGDGSTWDLMIYNRYSVDVSGEDLTAFASYVASHGRHYITGVDCDS